MTLHDFSRPEEARRFGAIDDVVMGGRSWSRLAHDAAAALAAFEGEVSLEDGGGFASVRSEPTPRDLSAFRGLALRVRGDGRRYKLNVRTDAAFDCVTWQAAFRPAPGAWEEVSLPWPAFEPRFRGRPVAAGALDAARVVTLGLLVSDRQAGPFRLELAWIAAVR